MSILNISFFVGLLAVVVFFVFWQITGLRSSSTWIPVNGKIIHSELKVSHSVKLYRGQIDAGVTYYMTDIEYTYVVDGKTYVGKKLMANEVGNFRNQADALDVLKQYPLNKEVTVYYDPNHPDQACLISGSVIPAKTYLVLGILVIVIICVAVAVWFAMGRYRN